jgi:hypothetical protein
MNTSIGSVVIRCLEWVVFQLISYKFTSLVIYYVDMSYVPEESSGLYMCVHYFPWVNAARCIYLGL